MAGETGSPLKLLAQDDEDLRVVSAALQDAVAKVGDIVWEAGPRRLTIAFNRYRWEADGRRERVRSAVQVGCALAVRSRRIRREAKRAVVELLAVEFRPGDPPGGQIVFEFAGGADLSVDVECIDVVLADLSEAWPARAAPRHEDDKASP